MRLRTCGALIAGATVIASCLGAPPPTASEFDSKAMTLGQFGNLGTLGSNGIGAMCLPIPNLPMFSACPGTPSGSASAASPAPTPTPSNIGVQALESPLPTPTPTPVPTPIPTPVATPTPTPVPTPTPTPVPTPTPTPIHTPTPTPTPVHTPTPTPTPQSACKVTGGGYVKPDSQKINFSFEAKHDNHGYSGNLTVEIDGTNTKYHASDIATLDCSRPTGVFTGTLDSQQGGRNAGSSFRVTVTDNGEPGTSDTFQFRITSGQGSGTTFSGTVKGGNIQFH